MTSPRVPPTPARSASPAPTSALGGTTGATSSSSSSPASATAWASATSGASPTSVTRVEEVNILVHVCNTFVGTLEWRESVAFKCDIGYPWPLKDLRSLDT